MTFLHQIPFRWGKHPAESPEIEKYYHTTVYNMTTQAQKVTVAEYQIYYLVYNIL